MQALHHCLRKGVRCALRQCFSGLCFCAFSGPCFCAPSAPAFWPVPRLGFSGHFSVPRFSKEIRAAGGCRRPPPPRCFASQGRGLGTRTEHGGAWAHGRNIARGHNGPPGTRHSSAPAPLPGEPVPGGCCGRVIKINGNVMHQSLIRGRLTNSAGEPAAASDGPFLRIRSGAGISGAESVLCCVAPPVKEGACNCQAELNALQ